MRIGIDLRPAWNPNSHRRGVGKYTGQLARALHEANRRHELVFFIAEGQQVEPPLGRTVPLRTLRKPSRLNWMLDSLQLPGALRRQRLDLFQATETTSIPRSGAPRIWAHVHDLIPYLFWKDVGGKAPWDFQLGLRLARRRFSKVDLLITDSLHSQRDLCREVGIEERRVKVVYPACHERYQPQERDPAERRIRARYGISGPFIFYVGGSDFRKNLPRLAEAFGRFRKRGFGGHLVLAGESFLWNIAETRHLRGVLDRCGVTDCVEFPGYVPDEDLPDFYAACRVFVFPSLYEGFGLPVLEAIQCGSVVAASKASSIPEVAGEAAQYFDPESVEEMTAALEVSCFDEARRSLLREAGSIQRTRFCWQETARRLLELYETVG